MRKNKDKSPDPYDLVGDYIDEKCPNCGRRLVGNKAGHKWCVWECGYGLNEVKQALGE